MQPLFDAILEVIPPPSGDADGPLQMLVAALDYDNYLGQIAIGRVFRGTIHFREPVAVLGRDGEPRGESLENVFVFRGLERLPDPGGRGRRHSGRVGHCQHFHRGYHRSAGLSRGPAGHRH